MNRTLKLFLLLTAFIAPFLSAAADEKRVEWSAELSMTTDSTGVIDIKAKVPQGLHFYAFPPEGGYNALDIKVTAADNVTVGEIAVDKNPESHYDKNFGKELSWWAEDVSFSMPVEISGEKSQALQIAIRSQACDSTACFSPVTTTFDLYTDETARKAHLNESAGKVTTPEQLPEALTGGHDSWWSATPNNNGAHRTPWAIFILGFLGGLAALITPCVWPLIPMTLSFFLKKKKGKSIINGDAMTYGISIIVIYLVLGIAITLIFGAGKLNELSTSALFNIIFFAILVIFAISFFGAFDIKLPQKWSNAMDSRAESTTGIISIFFMAFTLVLVSFSCTGPIIGTLLVEAASTGNILGPALGMGGFAIGLALPFTLCAMFPSMLKEMPKSGGWLNTVKVVLGFIELILSLKFLSVADLAYGWRILDREVFLSLWIVLFTLLGFYLLGKIRFSHDSKSEHTGVGRFFLALFPLAFAVYLLPGLWGAPLKAVSAFAPPLSTQDFDLYSSDETYIEFSDYNEGMEYAAEHNMPVLMDFTGYGCVNCRNMEVEVFDDSRVRNFLAANFVVIKLYVDDHKSKLPMPIEITDVDGKKKTISYYGEKWTFLQNYKFGAGSQPYYIILDNSGNPISKPVYYDNNVERFMLWLEEALEKYRI